MRRLLLSVLFLVFCILPPAFAAPDHQADELSFVLALLDMSADDASPPDDVQASPCRHCGKKVLASASQDHQLLSLTVSQDMAVNRDSLPEPAFAYRPAESPVVGKPAGLAIVTTHHDPPLLC